MADFIHIYQHQAEAYHALVSAEDYQGNIAKAIERLLPTASNSRYLDIGAGTGRVASILKPHSASLLISDISLHMLAIAYKNLAGQNVQLFAADNRHLPLPDKTADFITAGWTFGHFTDWYPDSWQEEIGKALDEMFRLLRPRGTAVILETLGTGRATPAPPNPSLAAYYRWLQEVHQFQHRWLRTDYRFPTSHIAVETLQFFFDNELTSTISEQQLTIIPECTGLWWHQLS